jgi:hypothetical protein
LLGANTGHHTQNAQPAPTHLEWILKDKLASQAPFDAVTLVNNKPIITDEIERYVTQKYQTDERHIPLYDTESGVKYDDENEKCFKELVLRQIGAYARGRSDIWGYWSYKVRLGGGGGQIVLDKFTGSKQIILRIT